MNKSFGIGLTVSLLAVFNPCVAQGVEVSFPRHYFKQNLTQTALPPNFINQSTSNLILKNHNSNQTKARVEHTSSNSITGTASWYGPGFEGRVCANGEVFDPNALTAAHPSLPFNTRVRVTNLHNGRSVVVRINDRGPYANNRIIDLSARAAREIGMYHNGVAQVRLEIL